MIKPWQDVWRAREDRHTVRYRSPRHVERNSEVYSPIVDPRQNMAMQINQCMPHLNRSLILLFSTAAGPRHVSAINIVMRPTKYLFWSKMWRSHRALMQICHTSV